ncbi:hypothetical protein UFOVP1666_192 [uncultured Caudovirales phage]|uniref:Uncharacterized protein n=1 Tax=uncultured Caudovirales phage TaxID=2100421 RepID=A0A6J5Q2U9_9CAUD|nr:hypothetical protein UFOVP867_147 [uncultured Caudovirales phage]CAB4170554.1 hypothetical protein UFOVP913_51 [uncultured Caudovirales phage]CAB4176967.1 hypothetical protein UFOVP993_104 [uncultured Caudovirales phage]CAB4223393.1 hypothetical protein UFOVP1666_192 [uncultured Caudovirales phage]
MNIFYLDKDVYKCAKMHVDKHCVKMILEYAQLLSTAHRLLDGRCDTQIANGRKYTSWTFPDYRNELLYKATHINHPSAVWVRESRANYKWLWKLLEALCSEYTYRYSKVHKVQREGLLEELRFVPGNMCVLPEFTEPPCCMPDDCKVGRRGYVIDCDWNVIESYRNYYKVCKSHMFVWKNRVQPVWVDA